MKKYLSILYILLFCNIYYTFSQAIGDWSIYMAYHDATKTAPAGKLIYVLSDGSLYSYDTEDTSLQTYDKTNYLNDVEIKNIIYISDYKTLLIAYKNSNIDLLINDEETFNIPDFMNKSMFEDKTINNIYINNEYAYLSTNFGIVVVNIEKKEISNSYNLGKVTNNCILVDKTIYAATEEGIYTGKITDNLLDKSNWKLDNNKIFNNIIYYDNTILVKDNSGLYKYNSLEQILNGSYSYININNNQLILGNSYTTIIYNGLANKNSINTEYTNHISYSQNTYWGSNGSNGLNGYKLNTDRNQLEKVIESIIPNSPRRNLDYYMTFTENKLLIAGGSLNYNRIVNPGTAMIYENHEWKYLDENISAITNIDYINATSIVQDPTDENHHFVSTARKGLYEFQNGKFINLYTYNNSMLQTIVESDPYNYVSVDGLVYDKNNNLWMLNNEVSNILKVMKKDGSWISLNYPEIANLPTTEKLIFDKRGWGWGTSRRELERCGIFCFNTNNTLENINDDQIVFRRIFINQNSEQITPNYIYTITEDLEGTIWIGTDVGPIVINNPSNIFESNTCTRIIIPRNDGSNLGDYLLEHESIKAISIDGANRKWIGTESSGIYLLSADGLETIHHFTTENSPLISNNIESIAIDPNSGEVFIGTNKGLVSYRSDAISGIDGFDDNKVHAYPNPVPSYHDGLIAVTGLMRDSNVKIVDISGKLIYSGTSLGGQFTWNGKDRNGKRVPSGIYLVLATNEEGKEGIATKIVMIK